MANVNTVLAVEKWSVDHLSWLTSAPPVLILPAIVRFKVGFDFVFMFNK